MSDSFSWWGVLSAVGVLTGLGITFGALWVWQPHRSS